MRTVDNFRVGDRVEWSNNTGYGLRHSLLGQVEKITPKKLVIRLDLWSKKPVYVLPHNVRHTSGVTS